MQVSEPGPTAGVYTISVAAELAGVTIRSLRLYEQHGLLQPGRTIGGTRRYSQDDLRRLRRIAELVADGVNLTGIGKILDLEQDTRDLRTRQHRAAADNSRLRADRDEPPDREPAAPDREPARRRSPSGTPRPTGAATGPPDRADPRPASTATERTTSEQAHHPAGPAERTRVMHDPAQSAVTALTGSTTETVGRFTYDVPTDTLVVVHQPVHHPRVHPR